MAEIVISEFMDETAIREGLARFDALYDPALVDRPADLAAAVADARALIVRNRTLVGPALLESAARLQCVGRLGVGLDNIDLAACKAHGIAVYPATGANDVAVAEYVVATAMMLLRGAYASTADVIAGAWPRNRLMGHEISGKRLGLVGFGAIARETATRAIALGMSVAAHDPFVEPGDPAWGPVQALSLDDLLVSSDVVSLHVPLTARTRGLIGAEVLSAMRAGAYLINLARGGVVDEQALLDVLKRNGIAGAALDVFMEEPLPADHPFWSLPNVLITTHQGGFCDVYPDLALPTVETNMRCFLDGQPHRMINVVEH